MSAIGVPQICEASSGRNGKYKDAAAMKVIYTYTDEAPALATHSFLPVVEALARVSPHRAAVFMNLMPIIVLVFSVLPLPRVLQNVLPFLLGDTLVGRSSSVAGCVPRFDGRGELAPNDGLALRTPHRATQDGTRCLGRAVVAGEVVVVVAVGLDGAGAQREEVRQAMSYCQAKGMKSAALVNTVESTIAREADVRYNTIDARDLPKDTPTLPDVPRRRRKSRRSLRMHANRPCENGECPSR